MVYLCGGFSGQVVSRPGRKDNLITHTGRQSLYQGCPDLGVQMFLNKVVTISLMHRDAVATRFRFLLIHPWPYCPGWGLQYRQLPTGP